MIANSHNYVEHKLYKLENFYSFILTNSFILSLTDAETVFFIKYTKKCHVLKTSNY